MEKQKDTNSLELGDVIEIRRRVKVIGFEGPDTLTLDLGDGMVERWHTRIVDRGDLDARVVDDSTVERAYEIDGHVDIHEMWVSLDNAVLDALDPKEAPHEVTVTLEFDQ